MPTNCGNILLQRLLLWSKLKHIIILPHKVGIVNSITTIILQEVILSFINSGNSGMTKTGCYVKQTMLLELLKPKGLTSHDTLLESLLEICSQ